jgi:hypothetical protein
MSMAAHENACTILDITRGPDLREMLDGRRQA